MMLNKLFNFINLALILLTILVIGFRVYVIDVAIYEQTNLLGYRVDASTSSLRFDEALQTFYLTDESFSREVSLPVVENFELDVYLADWQVLESGVLLPPSDCKTIEIFQSLEFEIQKIIRIECI